jgi:hypothetical protein
VNRNSKRKVVFALASTLSFAVLLGPVAEAKKSVTSLRGGYYCRDLKRFGYSYGEALRYWRYWGEPDNMDADLNGIPCETVYTAAQVRRYFP